MFNIFKVKIPKENVQEVSIQESWTVEWESYVYYTDRYGIRKFNAKVFINQKDADEYIKQLKECAKFINTQVNIEKKKN